MDIATTIRDLRTNIGLTQKGLADALYVSESTVQKWEAGKNSPTIEMLSKVLSLSGQSLAIVTDSSNNTNGASASDAPVRPAGKNTRCKDMSMPDWVEDRFGNDILDWAEERWGSNDDWDDDYWDDGEAPEMEETCSKDDVHFTAQMKEFLFDEISENQVYEGKVEAFLTGFGKISAFVNIDGLVVLCEVPSAAIPLMRKGDNCYVHITRKDSVKKCVYGSVVHIRPIFTATINYVTGKPGHEVAVVGADKADVAPVTVIPLSDLSEAEGYASEECKRTLPGTTVEFELVNTSTVNNKRLTALGENKKLYARKRKDFWYRYDSADIAHSTINTMITHVSRDEIAMFVHGARITLTREDIPGLGYCSDLREKYRIGQMCQIKVMDYTLSEDPKSDGYPVSVKAEKVMAIEVDDPCGELLVKIAPALRTSGYEVAVFK